MGFLDNIFKKNSELEWMYDYELIEDTSTRIHLKKLAINVCVSMIARTISQSEFYLMKDKKKVDSIAGKDMAYKLNVRPNPNTQASHFWQTVISKLLKDNEVLVIQSDTGDLHVADSFIRSEYPLIGDTFKEVVVGGYPFNRVFNRKDVIYLQYGNENVTKLLDSLYDDYGELFGRIIEFQKRKNQIRGTVDIEMIGEKSKEQTEKLQKYIDNLYKAITEKSVAIIPQQKGFTYNEEKNNAQLQSVDEVNKVTDGFLDHVANAYGIPITLLKGDMADIEKITRNYMTFCISPIIRKLQDELNAILVSKGEYSSGTRMVVRSVSYVNIFEVAGAVDKLRSSGTLTGNEIREELGFERLDDEMMDQIFITKNYQDSSEAAKGGENE